MKNSKEILFKDEYGKYIFKKDNVIFAKGGDGTLLRAINMFRDMKLPFFGIAGGTENFLMNDNEEINHDAKYKKFKLIKVKVFYYTPNMLGELIIVKRKFQAFNDIMIGGDMNSWIGFKVHDKDKIIREFIGGGLIISTAQGSTGINKNNGGVILPLSSNNWSITGDKTNKPINYVIEPHKTSISVNARTPVNIWIDGSNHIIRNVSKVVISSGDDVEVIFNKYDKFKRKRG